MKRLEILKTFDLALRGESQATIKVPRSFNIFGKKLKLGTRFIFKVVSFASDPILKSGFGFTKLSAFGGSYAAIFNSMGTLEDLVIFSFVQYRVPREHIEEDVYDLIVSHVQELREHLEYEGSIKKLEL